MWFILQRPPFFTRKNGRIGTASDSLILVKNKKQIKYPCKTATQKRQNKDLIPILRDYFNSQRLHVQFLLTVPGRCFFCRSFLLFMFRVCHAFLSVIAALWSPLGKGMTSWLSCMLCFIVFCGQVWYLIVLIPDLCLLAYFDNKW